ncbi:MAG: MFS transporter [Opitutales bacterium]|jgi:MFS family permease
MSERKESAASLPAFRRYLASVLFGTLAIQVQAVAVAWQVYELTKDPLALGAIGLAEVIPFVCSVLFAGHVADTRDRRLVAAISLTAMLLLGGLLLLPGLVEDFPFPLLLLYAVVTFGGVARSFLTTARQALIGEVVPHSLLGDGVRWRNAVFEGSCVVGPALAGLLWAAGGPTLTYSVMTGFFALSLAGCLAIDVPKSLRTREPEPVLRSLRAGIDFMLGRRLLLGAFTLDLFAVLFGGAVALLPVFAAEILHVGPVGLGLLRAAPSLGAVLMSVIMLALPPVRRAGPLLYASFAVFGLATIAFGLSTSFMLSCLFLLIIGGADAVNVIIRQTILQTGTPPALMGRVSAVTAVFIGCSNELGAFESGAAARLLGTVGAVVFGGVATFGVMAGVAWRFPEIWRLDRIAPDQR